MAMAGPIDYLSGAKPESSAARLYEADLSAWPHMSWFSMPTKNSMSRRRVPCLPAIQRALQPFGSIRTPGSTHVFEGLVRGVRELDGCRALQRAHLHRRILRRRLHAATLGSNAQADFGSLRCPMDGCSVLNASIRKISHDDDAATWRDWCRRSMCAPAGGLERSKSLTTAVSRGHEPMNGGSESL